MESVKVCYIEVNKSGLKKKNAHLQGDIYYIQTLPFFKSTLLNGQANLTLLAITNFFKNNRKK